MDFGMPTLIEQQNLKECTALCNELGLSFIELNMNMPGYQPDVIDDEAIREMLSQGRYFTIHLDEGFNPCDLNKRIRQAYLDTFMETARLALKYSMPVINMHMADGIYFTLPDRKVYQYNIYKEQYIDNILHFRELAGELLADSGTMVCVENTSGYHDFHQEAIELLLESGVFSLTYDIGHHHLAKRGDEAFILKHKDRLSHMHLHDADTTCHKTLGTGELDLENYLRLAETTGCRCVVETKTVQALRDSRDYLYNRGKIS